MKRSVPTLTFQPTKEVDKRLRPKRKKLPRGYATNLINLSLEKHFGISNHDIQP